MAGLLSVSRGEYANHLEDCMCFVRSQDLMVKIGGEANIREKTLQKLGDFQATDVRNRTITVSL